MSILDRLTRTHRAAHAELREGMAALERVNGVKMPKQRSYDPKCFSLAEDFLDDHRPFTEAEAQDLAQTIQDAIEDWFFARENSMLQEQP
jgi:hypothetical protein